MEVINLLGTQAKAEIRAARLNVRLRRFALLSFFACLVVFAIYGVGFYYVMQEKAVAEQQLNQDKAAVQKFEKILNEARTYKSNLAIASKVLSTGTSYSTFLTETARILPPGSILTGLTLSNLGASSTVAKSNTFVLNARATSYGGALLVKENLETSALYENVSLNDVTAVEITTQSTALDKKYPFILTIKATASTQTAAGQTPPKAGS